MKVLFIAGALLLPAASQATPQGVYKALQSAVISPKNLPRGFSGPTTRTFTPSANSQSHHAIGGVEILLNSGGAEIVYVVFPTRADALADWKSAPRVGLKLLKTPDGLPSPALEATGRSSSGDYALGAFVDGSIVAETALHLKGAPGKNDVAALTALVKGALAHLQSVERKAG